MEKWLVAAKRADFAAIAQEFHIDPVLARILRNRDLTGSEEIGRFLNGTLDDLYDPFLLKDMDRAVDTLSAAIADRRKIRIIGDYDVDGICASYILLYGIKTLGGEADTAIPHRIADGYGVNEHLIREAHTDGIALLLTCDNGIAAAEPLSLAKDLGMDVVVTDHHEVPFTVTDGEKRYELPDALAVVDPKRADDTYPFPGICGALIAYKLVEALLTRIGAEEKEAVLSDLLPFAALATVCDVMELRDENRIVVRYGLMEMARTQNPGLKALLAVNDLQNRPISTYHCGFILGPCLNATGRLDTAERALALFNAKTDTEAYSGAQALKELNEARKKMTEDGAKEAIRRIEEGEEPLTRVLVLYLPDCHESLAGIIAGRVKEHFFRPTIVLTDAEEGVKGSARSIEGYDMFAELSAVKELFTRFGGHPMAAGLSLADRADIAVLRRRLNENCTLDDEALARRILIDVPMPLSYITKELIRSFEHLAPFGTGNPKPVFADKGVHLLSYQRLGKHQNVGKLKIADGGGSTYEMVTFEPLPPFETFLKESFGEEIFKALLGGYAKRGDAVIQLVYYPEINEFRGSETIQIVMRAYRKAPE